MQFDLDNDQAQLQDSLRRLLQADASFERRRAAASSEAGWDAPLWPALAELGVTALTLSEDHGGFAQRPIAWLPVMQELGRALALQPFLPTAVLAATAIARSGTAAQLQEWLPAIAEGSRVLAFAHEEPATRHARLWVETRATRSGSGWVLDGTKQNVLFAPAADALVVSARTEGRADEPQGLALFLVRGSQGGVRLNAHRLIDDTPAADIELRSAVAQRLGDGDSAHAWAALQAAQQAGLAATCAESLGIAERACELTMEYVQARQQFGRAIGSNQAVRHRVAEMHVALEMVRSAAMAALLALEMDDAAARSRELSRAKMLVSRHATFIAQQAIQLHGGIGMTVEYAVGHALRRLTVLEQSFGDGPAHAARLGAELAASQG